MKRLGAGLFALWLLVMWGCAASDSNQTTEPLTPSRQIESANPGEDSASEDIDLSSGAKFDVTWSQLALSITAITSRHDVPNPFDGIPITSTALGCNVYHYYPDECTECAIYADPSSGNIARIVLYGTTANMTSADEEAFKAYAMLIASGFALDSELDTMYDALAISTTPFAQNTINFFTGDLAEFSYAITDGLLTLRISPVDQTKSDDAHVDGESDAEDNVILPDEDGFAMGYTGDTLRTAFFDMTINTPYTCDEFDGLTPSQGHKFLVAELTLYNYTNFSQPVFDTDFEVMWDLDDDDAWALPESDEVMGEDGKIDYFVKSEKQLPVAFNLGIHKTVTGILLYQVPVDSKDYFIDFYEVYDDGTEEGQYGDAFYVRFSE